MKALLDAASALGFVLTGVVMWLLAMGMLVVSLFLLSPIGWACMTVLFIAWMFA